jgi:processive 1,2-diacylglycerol beta-glucosyltransferase
VTRVLILTASVGEGHDLPARTLADQLRVECPGVDVVTEDGLQVMGKTFVLVNVRGAGIVFFRFRWIWDAAFWLCVALGPTRRLTQKLVRRLGSRGMLELIQRVRPDVIVSVYPQATEVLGRLRRKGRLDVPVCAAITDLSALHYWATPGADLHLVTHPESMEEVRSIAGARTPVHWVHGFTAPEFLVPRPVADARRSLGLEESGKMVIVSGGGWGIGDVQGAVEEVLSVGGVAEVVCLCGRNEELCEQLSHLFADEPRVRIEPFTDRMPDWLAAADALVHSTGGLTVLEALMRGCPAISYGWGRGHVRMHNAAFQRFGLAEVAGTRAGLHEAVTRALEQGRRETDFSGLPSAASYVLAAADGTRTAAHAH